jgi:hypothetical protein
MKKKKIPLYNYVFNVFKVFGIVFEISLASIANSLWKVFGLCKEQ